jgi:hypothetical protein
MVGKKQILLDLTGSLGKDSLSLVLTMDPLVAVNSITPLPPLFSALEIIFTEPIPGSSIRIRVEGLKGCNGKPVPAQTVQALSFSPASPRDIVINEILFDPPDGGADYVELYNRGEHAIDLAEIQIANRDAANRISSFVPLTRSAYALLPGDYVVFTADPDWLKNKYQPPQGARMVMHKNLPSFPDNIGEVILLNQGSEIIDELNYDARWHFELVSVRKGRSLERISSEAPTNDKANWHTASTSSGYGTPGYANSQSLPGSVSYAPIHLSSKLISPDMDGRDDLLLIHYNFTKPGVVANVTVYDTRGRPLKYIARNQICGTTGSFKWDGLDEAGAILPKGLYIILTHTFDLTGKTMKYRDTVGIMR